MQDIPQKASIICSQRLTSVACAFVMVSIILASSGLKAAYKWQNHADLISAVKEYVSKHIDSPDSDYNLTINRIDSRLRLHQCDSSVTAFLPSSGSLSGKSTVGIRCNGKRPWKVYIPIQVTRYKDIVVSKHPLLKGQIIDKNSIAIAKIELTSTNQAYFTRDKYVLGKILKRALGAGKPIKARYLKAANIVFRGQEVILKATTASIQVIMSGKALTDGAEGELIRVRNSKTHRIVEGIVTKSGTIQVRM
ncbi:MAG: flagellar basal body P-ring formation chaperone FlgA [Thiohalomonadales bacterium]